MLPVSGPCGRWSRTDSARSARNRANTRRARCLSLCVAKPDTYPYWGNGLRADLGVKRGIANILLDVRRGDGPPAARHWTFPALATTERLVKERPDIAARAVRAIVKTQRALRADPQLAAKAAQRLFPAEEASLNAYEVARDAPFYNPTISEEMVAHISRFAREIGALEGEVRYGELVATQFAGLWHG